MANFKKQWNNNDIYNFTIEFNRIENYNKYVEKWLREYFGYYIVPNLTNKTDWTNNDIPDVNDLNRIKNNINKLLSVIGSSNRILIMNQVNQVWGVEQANEMESRLYENYDFVSNAQFQVNITGLSVCGSENPIKIV